MLLKKLWYTRFSTQLRKGLSKEDSNRYARYEDLSFAMDQMLYSPDAMDEARYERYEKESDDLYSELYHKPWFLRLKDLKRLMENDGYRYRYLYTNSAGEIEARDAASRRKMTAEERRNRMPDTGDENTVFPEDATKKSSQEVEAQDRRRYSVSREFKRDIEKVFEKEYFEKSHLLVGETPEFLGMFGFDVSKPLMITSKHARDIMTEPDGVHSEYHGLSKKDLISALTEMNDPVLAISSVNKDKKEDGTIMLLTTKIDKSKNPIGVYVSPDRKGYYNRLEVDLNLVKSVYGKDATFNFIKEAATENRLLYLNKNKSQQLQHIPGVYFPNNIPTVDFKKSITRYKDIVNKLHDNTRKSIGSDSAYLDAVNRGDMTTAQRMVDEAAEVVGYELLL